MKNRSLLLPQAGVLDRDMWPCRETRGIPPYELVFLPRKKTKELRLLLTL